jgi:hypothetical protein
MDEVMGAFSVQASGNVGQVIRGPDGHIIAWTMNGWVAKVICRLLTENEELLSVQEKVPAEQ